MPIPINQAKQRKGRVSLKCHFCLPSQKFLVSEHTLSTVIQNTKQIIKKSFQTSALEKLWKASRADPPVYQVLSCEVRVVGFFGSRKQCRPQACHQQLTTYLFFFFFFFSVNILIAAARDWKILPDKHAFLLQKYNWKQAYTKAH